MPDEAGLDIEVRTRTDLSETLRSPTPEDMMRDWISNQFGNKLIDSLDPKYLSLQHQIIFKRNVTYKNLSFCNCSGINYNDGEEIEINYDENNAWLKIVICHELLHSFIKDIPLDLEEKLVRDISKTGVCYNTIKKRVSLEL